MNSKKYILMGCLVVVVILMGIFYWHLRIESMNIQQPPQETMHWSDAAILVSQCQAASLESVNNPSIQLKDGEVIKIVDSPGYPAMLDAVQAASSKCGSIHVGDGVP